MDKFKVLLTGLFCVGLLLMGCGEKKEQEKSEAVPPVPEEVKTCVYELNQDDTKLTWVSFKLTEKIAVKGSFDSIQVNGIKSAETLLGALGSLSFQINGGSANSDNAERDKKLSEKYFGIMQGGLTISGNVKEVLENGSVVVSIAMNGVEKDLPLSVTVESDTTLLLKGSMDTDHWNMGASLNSLNKVCKLLHTGKDGISKLWPNVDIIIKAAFKKTCS